MRHRLLLVVATLASLAAPDARAQSEPARGRAIEEIIVTAQKTEENVREVPISMSVLDDDFIAEQGIADYRDLALYVPNAHVDPGNGLFPDVNIRGFGSALSNKAFEQSVGLAIDGVPYGRAPYFQGPLFDLQRVEVLRGPQGTLFGKNTTAGLLNVVTEKPTDELTGDVDVELGQLNQRRFEVAAGGPVVRGLLDVRLSALTDERDGLVRNTTAAVRPEANERMNDRDRQGVRFQLGLPDLLGANLVVGYEHVDFDYTGIGWEFDRIPDRMKSFYRQFDPNTDFTPRNFVGSVDTGEFNTNRMDTVVANAGYDLGGWRLAAVGGWSKLDVRSLIDDDFGPEPFTWNTSSDDNPQTTFELRGTSPSLPGFFGLERVFGVPLGGTDFTAGFFWQDRKIDNSELTINLNLPVFAQFLVAQGVPLSFIGGLPATPILPAGLVPPLDPIYAAFPTIAAAQANTGIASTTMRYAQTTTSLAGFGQMNWHPLDRWTLQAGGRIANEQKDASWHRTFSPVTGAVFLALEGEEFTAGRSRSETEFTPKVSLRYDWTDDVATYASWAKGYKAGGFNEQAFNNTDESLEFAPEKATAWEVGSKVSLLDGAAAVNLALFRENVTDFQVLTLPPNSVATTVVNAGEARAQGLEMDATWLPTPWLTMVGTLAFNDSEFLSFVLGQCSFDRPDTDGNGDGRCDATGQPLFRTPKWAATLAPSARVPLDSLVPWKGLDFLANGTAEYQDVQFLERTYDERVRQSPFFRFGAGIGVGHRDQGWSLRLSVYNLTDRKTGVLIRDVPFGGGNFAQIPEPPRLVFGSFRWAF
jgi:iron complex outermembrane recepter protein